jgi:hypothetical protein
MLTEIRAKNSREKMQLMDELTEEYSPPEKLTVLTRRPELSAFFYGKVHHRTHITATRTESGRPNSLYSHHIFIYNLSYYYTVIYVKYAQMVISLHDSRRSRLLHPSTLFNNLSSSPLVFHQVQKPGNFFKYFSTRPKPEFRP